MSKFTPTGGSLDTGSTTTTVDGLIASSPNIIQRLSIPAAATEYSYTLPLGTVRFRLHNVGSRILQVAYIAGNTVANYYEMAPRSMSRENNLDPTVVYTIYVQSAGSGQLMEIISWS
jgi:hypothetical protein